jgi:uncharacterized protein
VFSDPYFPVLLIAAFIAGSINAVAGGGTLFSFSALGLSFGAQALSEPLKLANTTNSALLTPASISSALAFIKELRVHWRRLAILAVPTVLGAYSGALVLGNTSDSLFRRIVPFLVLFAVMLFAFKDRIGVLIRQLSGSTLQPAGPVGSIGTTAWVFGVGFQFLVAFYGGYFGAGIGILMISSFSLMGMRDMHVMNAIKNPLAFLINGVAALKFAFDGLVRWEYALPMAVCAIVGGFLTARVSRRINQSYLRAFVIAYGCVISAFLFARFTLRLF